MQIQNENLFRSYLNSGINLFLGAGFSLFAKGDGKNLPVGDKLKDELLHHFGRKVPSALSLAQNCQIIGSTHKVELENFFRNRFTVTDFDESYLNLERVKVKSIFTTNIDDLIYKIYSLSQAHYINDLMMRGPAIGGGAAVDYIALHGCVAHGDSEFAFAPVELASSFERDKDKWYGYIGRIQSTPTLYWGYRVEDAGVLQALSKESSNGRAKADAWIVLRENDPEAIEYYSSLGFQTIIGDTLSLLKYFGQIPRDKTISKNKPLIFKNFSEYRIPALTEVPVRSINEFYWGAEPSWYDIFSGKIHETAHLTSAKNAVAGPKHVLLLGSAVSGKSTLLKQLAIRSSGERATLYVEEISPEKAKLLRRDVEAEGQQLTLYVDNVADVSEVLATLIDCPLIKFVGAERDYVFDSVAHKFPRSKFEILNISGLSPIDIQSVENRIPADVKRKVYRSEDDQLGAHAAPTFFEVITSTVLENSLADRYLAALKEFKGTQPVQHGLLMLACYLYSCRVPTSVDIATAFLRSHHTSPVEALELLTSMSSFLSVYEGALADDEQSYYVPRSRAVAEVVMRRAHHEDLRHMLDCFHREVSPTKIGRYDIFRRNAYDAKLIARAYPDWHDGLEFYERATERDKSHSLKQQGALYLSLKKNYELAFAWIDSAQAQAGRLNPSVRNSFAVILFSANFEKLDSPEVRRTLDESMTILEKCHSDDHRKLYHARIFAEQALNYSEKYPNSSSAKSYLERSERWISTELQLRGNDRWTAVLLRKVQRALRQF